jgi:hypothetical protein
LLNFWAFYSVFARSRVWTSWPESGSLAKLVFIWAPEVSFTLVAPMKIWNTIIVQTGERFSAPAQTSREHS